MKTLSEYLIDAIQRGYSGNFRVAGDRLIGWVPGQFYTSKEVSVVDFFRYEDSSDSQDTSILYLIETNDGLKGTLIDNGLYVDSMISDFVNEIEFLGLKPRT